MELIDKVLNSLTTLSAWRNFPDSEERRNLSELHFVLYGQKLSDKPKCGCVDDFVTVLRGTSIEKLTLKYNTMAEKLFKLKPGKVIQSFAIPEPLTQASSDEMCMRLLKSNEKTIKFFESYPENWKELVANFDPKAPAEEPTTEEPTTEEPTTEEPTTEEPTTENTLDLDAMSETQLRDFAKANEINLKGAKTKASVKDAIVAHLNDI